MTPTACWEVGPDETWHMDDMAIDCASGTHVMFMMLGYIFIILYPIGIPLTFLLLLRRNETGKLCEGCCLTDDEKQTMKKFKRLDLDGDGDVTSEELLKAGMSKIEVTRLMAKYDADGNGVLDQQEYSNLVQIEGWNTKTDFKTGWWHRDDCTCGDC